MMNNAPYFNNRARRKHPEIPIDQIRRVVENPEFTEVQPDGRIRLWGEVTFVHNGRLKTMYARVVMLEDGVTLLNAFPDGSFTKKHRREAD